MSGPCHRRRQLESSIQRTVIETLAWCARPDVFAFHVPLGGYRRPVEAAILKSVGTVAGIPDVLCIFEGRVFALEIKTERGRVTDVQRVTHERLRRSRSSSDGAYCEGACHDGSHHRVPKTTQARALDDAFHRQARGGRHPRTESAFEIVATP